MPSTSPLLIGLSAFATINLASFLAFGWDKHCARNAMHRISEANLLMLAFCGGAIGAKIGQRHFRHKTSKQPFGLQLNLILWLQVLVVAVFVFPQTHDAIAAFLRDW